MTAFEMTDDADFVTDSFALAVDAGIEIDLEAADLDKNGTVNTRDAMILARYVNGWEGYDIYFTDTEE